MEILFIYLGFVGLFIGSFLNVLIDRLPVGKSVTFDRSQCDFCHKTLRWFELIPLFSFLIQGGKCRRCHKKLSFLYPVMELTTGVLFCIISYFTWTNPLLLVSSLIIACSLLVIIGTDLKFFYIPDSMLITAVLGAILLHLGSTFPVYMQFVLTGCLAFFSLYAIFLATKEKGMGFGDVKLAFFLGFFLGFPKIIACFYLAFLTGAIVGIILIGVRNAKLKSRVPFGPFLILGCIGTLLFYEQISAFFSSFV